MLLGGGGVSPPSLSLQRSVCNPCKDELEKSVQIFLTSLDHVHALSVELLFVFRVKIVVAAVSAYLFVWRE